MKSARSIGKARNARMNQTIKHAEALAELLKRFQGTPHDVPLTDADLWEDGRSLVNQLVQCFHESNAYNNATVPDGTSFEQQKFSTAMSVTAPIKSEVSI